MKKYDVIIAGAGPAGSTCAWRLRELGFSVKLFDKVSFPRVKPCAGWITPQIVEALQLDVDDFRQKHTFQPITGFVTGMIGGKTVETRFHEPVSFGIRRIEFDDYLLRRCGASCDFQAVRTIVAEDGQWRVNEEFAAPLLIGAGGHFCPVARFLQSGDHRPESKSSSSKEKARQNVPEPVLIFAQEIEFEAPAGEQTSSGVDPETPELYFCQDLKGYGWCFRKGNFLNVGLGRFEKEGLREHVSGFCQFLRSHGKLGEPLPTRFQGHVYRLYAMSPPKLCEQGVVLVGDAAGLAYPNSGEGIRPAVESALLAADVIANADRDYSAESLAEYRRQIATRFGRPASYAISGWIPAAWLQSVAARLMANRWFARNIVIDKWFLHRQQESLLVPRRQTGS